MYAGAENDDGGQHFTECHDPLAAVKKERGEKIVRCRVVTWFLALIQRQFACHQATCDRLFMTPKARRLHLIQAHGYPKEYFFAVTNKGVGGLLRKWGEGASMIRKEWKPREQKGKEAGDVQMEDEEDEEENEEGVEDDGRSSDDVIVYEKPGEPGDGEDALTQRMNALSLVPQSVRFGRGGRRGLARPPRSLGWRGRGRAGIMRTRGS